MENVPRILCNIIYTHTHTNHIHTRFIWMKWYKFRQINAFCQRLPTHTHTHTVQPEHSHSEINRFIRIKSARPALYEHYYSQPHSRGPQIWLYRRDRVWSSYFCAPPSSLTLADEWWATDRGWSEEGGEIMHIKDIHRYVLYHYILSSSTSLAGP